MTTINGVNSVNFKGEQDRRSSGMGIGVPIATTVLGGGIGYAISKQPDKDEFEKMVKSGETIKLKEGELSEADKNLIKDAKAELDAEAAKKPAEEAKTAPDAKTTPETKPADAKATPAAPTVAKTPEQIETVHSGKPLSRSGFIIKAGLIIASIPFFSLIYGMAFNAYNYRIRRMRLILPDLPASFDSFKIVLPANGSYRRPITNSTTPPRDNTRLKYHKNLRLVSIAIADMAMAI